MLTYSSSQEKRDHLKSRSEFQTFSLISGHNVCVPPRDTQHGVSILSSTNFSQTFGQITQQQNTTQI